MTIVLFNNELLLKVQLFNFLVQHLVDQNLQLLGFIVQLRANIFHVNKIKKNILTERGVNQKRLLVLSLFPLLSSRRKDMTCQCHIPPMPSPISLVQLDRSILSFIHLRNLQLI
jgi:hypothetical protein